MFRPFKSKNQRPALVWSFERGPRLREHKQMIIVIFNLVIVTLLSDLGQCVFLSGNGSGQLKGKLPFIGAPISKDWMENGRAQ